MTGAIRRFEVMAFVVGIALFVLLVAMFVRYVLGHPEFSEHYSPIHGALYIGYLVTVADLGRRARWSLPKSVGVALAGTVPALSFVVERRVVRELRGH